MNDVHLIGMTLQEQIKEQLKDAMRAKEQVKMMTLRGISAAFTNELVSMGMMPTDSLEDDKALAVLTRESKRRKDAIAQYEAAGRPELAEDEKVELAIIETFLPTLMSEEEVKAFVQAKMEELGVHDASEKGRFIGTVMSELKGKADGTMVSDVVSAMLG